MSTKSSATSAETSNEELEQILAMAHTAVRPWGSLRPGARADVLDKVAAALDAAAEQLIPLAAEETHLAPGRLAGELKRSTFQLRLFGQTLRDGGYLDARIDHADPHWPMGAPRPDLRRSYRPIGPVLVFAASNFPFAFSVAGGDTASALAAGNPVVLKAHPGHHQLSERTAEIMLAALQEAGAPEGVFALISGVEAGKEALKDPRIKASSFTGSIPGGRALMDIAVSRPEPIPFYGELGSNNPVFITPAAAAARGNAIVEEFISSFTLGAGQFCTKPGTIFVPTGSGIVEQLRAAVLPDAVKLLHDRIQSGFVGRLQELSSHERMEVLVQGPDPLGDPPSPTLLYTTAEHVLAAPRELEAECFGPAAVVIEYDDLAQLVPLAKTFEGQLTATIHGEDSDPVAGLVEVLAEKAGRVLWNQWPTGVSVTYAQQHGGPYPATTSPHTTSVGTAAIERFLRPVAYQGFPQHLLPEELQDANPLRAPRMVNGQR
ncbi:aldehyde dehydrogenase (NADP(+)) [Arthrobacter sp. ISL-30]|uniref:aldehyde dehydrogenase (NADP(+)) n=1 Tax=Arthrobacter sp. ISL-30 TaxID=2819109 RepID=UPI001BE77D4B|nr:aldehyde dehydrogenase (NADP(+)) [Arthrobacter sp. ISL-30]MBT2515678.1 aldehyde dehydrogenase (NADP(+)) [Arthrobacter sp. ISL-30]